MKLEKFIPRTFIHYLKFEYFLWCFWQEGKFVILKNNHYLHQGVILKLSLNKEILNNTRTSLFSKTNLIAL